MDAAKVFPEIKVNSKAEKRIDHSKTDIVRLNNKGQNFPRMDNVDSSLSDRLVTSLHKDAIYLILLFCNLKTILACRLSSKTFLNFTNILVNTISTYSPLESKSMIPFDFSQIYPKINPLISEKYEFCIKNTGINISIWAGSFFRDASKLIKDFSQKNLSITLKIISHLDLIKFPKLLSSSSQNLKEPLSKINGIDIELRNVNKEVRDLLSKFFEILCFDNFLQHQITTLSFNDVTYPLILPYFPNLKKLKIGTIGLFQVFIQNYPQLHTLKLGHICSSPYWMNFLPQLEVLEFEDILTDLEIPSFPELNTLEFKDICKGSLKLNNQPKLRSLKFGRINAPVTFPNSGFLKYVDINQVNKDFLLYPEKNDCCLL